MYRIISKFNNIIGLSFARKVDAKLSPLVDESELADANNQFSNSTRIFAQNVHKQMGRKPKVSPLEKQRVIFEAREEAKLTLAKQKERTHIDITTMGKSYKESITVPPGVGFGLQNADRHTAMLDFLRNINNDFTDGDVEVQPLHESLVEEYNRLAAKTKLTDKEKVRLGGLRDYLLAVTKYIIDTPKALPNNVALVNDGKDAIKAIQGLLENSNVIPNTKKNVQSLRTLEGWLKYLYPRVDDTYTTANQLANVPLQYQDDPTFTDIIDAEPYIFFGKELQRAQRRQLLTDNIIPDEMRVLGLAQAEELGGVENNAETIRIRVRDAKFMNLLYASALDMYHNDKNILDNLSIDQFKLLLSDQLKAAWEDAEIREILNGGIGFSIDLDGNGAQPVVQNNGDIDWRTLLDYSCGVYDVDPNRPSAFSDLSVHNNFANHYTAARTDQKRTEISNVFQYSVNKLTDAYTTQINSVSFHGFNESLKDAVHQANQDVSKLGRQVNAYRKELGKAKQTPSQPNNLEGVQGGLAAYYNSDNKVNYVSATETKQTLTEMATRCQAEFAKHFEEALNNPQVQEKFMQLRLDLHKVTHGGDGIQDDDIEKINDWRVEVVRTEATKTLAVASDKYYDNAISEQDFKPQQLFSKRHESVEKFDNFLRNQNNELDGMVYAELTNTQHLNLGGDCIIDRTHPRRIQNFPGGISKLLKDLQTNPALVDETVLTNLLTVLNAHEEIYEAGLLSPDDQSVITELKTELATPPAHGNINALKQYITAALLRVKEIPWLPQPSLQAPTQALQMVALDDKLAALPDVDKTPGLGVWAVLLGLVQPAHLIGRVVPLTDMEKATVLQNLPAGAIAGINPAEKALIRPVEAITDKLNALPAAQKTNNLWAVLRDAAIRQTQNNILLNHQVVAINLGNPLTNANKILILENLPEISTLAISNEEKEILHPIRDLDAQLKYAQVDGIADLDAHLAVLQLQPVPAGHPPQQAPVAVWGALLAVPAVAAVLPGVAAAALSSSQKAQILRNLPDDVNAIGGGVTAEAKALLKPMAHSPAQLWTKLINSAKTDVAVNAPNENVAIHTRLNGYNGATLTGGQKVDVLLNLPANFLNAREITVAEQELIRVTRETALTNNTSKLSQTRSLKKTEHNISELPAVLSEVQRKMANREISLNSLRGSYNDNDKLRTLLTDKITDQWLRKEGYKNEHGQIVESHIKPIIRSAELYDPIHPTNKERMNDAKAYLSLGEHQLQLNQASVLVDKNLKSERELTEDETNLQRGQVVVGQGATHIRQLKTNDTLKFGNEGRYGQAVYTKSPIPNATDKFNELLTITVDCTPWLPGFETRVYEKLAILAFSTVNERTFIDLVGDCVVDSAGYDKNARTGLVAFAAIYQAVTRKNLPGFFENNDKEAKLFERYHKKACSDVFNESHVIAEKTRINEGAKLTSAQQIEATSELHSVSPSLTRT